MPKTTLVIVESPTKAKTIRKFLPKHFIVEASMGHVRDLPQSAADIPQKLKKEEWAKVGVHVERDFEPLYIVPKGKSKVVQGLKEKLKDAEELFFATDEDREGESISWHLLELLKPKVPYRRMVFHEITKSAIQEALQHTREIDMNLVRAQETRRILDRLVGYTLSPLLWKKIAYGLSAGRVQSVGLRLIVRRERERLAFVSASYWDLLATLGAKSENFEAKLVSMADKRIAGGKDFDENTGKIREGKDVTVLGEDEAKKLAQRLKAETWKVTEVEEKHFQSKPSAPFITSTLQQEANRKLGLQAREAMRIAQRLYEEGLITYMRTDSPNLSTQAIEGARRAVADLYGAEYLSPEARQYSSKAKGAQEAHEAIRPAGSEFVHPRETGLSGKELALYELIWMRTVATQMAEAKKLSVTARIQAGDTLFQASGTRILFPGFLRAYAEGSDDPEAALEERELLLPPLKQGEIVRLAELSPQGHETKPPARFTEASLVQMLEKEGVGRPSTYASIIDTIVDRGYVRRQASALVPSFTGVAVIQLLEKNFEHLVDTKFTSKMEESLDEIAEGKVSQLEFLKAFYLGKEGLASQVKNKEKKIDPEESRTVDLHQELKGIEVKIGRYGPYLVRAGSAKKDEVHASIPEDIAPADLTIEKTEELIEISERGPEPLGQDPKSGQNVYVLSGRFGPYFQLGEVTEEHPKPRRASLLKGMDPKTVGMKEALEMLSLPRDLGVHPETGNPIQTNLGRFGPYVVHHRDSKTKDYRSLKKEDNVFTITLERALQLLAEEKKTRRGAQVVREIGLHPSDQEPIAVYDGKYGLYVKHKDTNATLPKDLKVEEVTLDQALALLKEREAQAPKTKRGSKKTKT
jgi:DNA topoisomerase-1